MEELQEQKEYVEKRLKLTDAFKTVGSVSWDLTNSIVQFSIISGLFGIVSCNSVHSKIPLKPLLGALSVLHISITLNNQSESNQGPVYTGP